MKKVMYFSISCLLFVTISYTYSAFTNKIVGNIVGTSNNWVFKANVPTGTKENDYFKVPVSGTSGSFNVTIDTTGSTKKAEYSIVLDRNTLPDDLKFYTDSAYSNLISNDTYNGNSNNSTSTITIYYKSTTGLNGNIYVRVKGNVLEYAMMKNGYSYSTGGTEFWNNTYKPYIRTITFTSDTSNKPTTCTDINFCWDISYDTNQNRKVYAYLVNSGLTIEETNSDTNETTTKELYNLYIVCNSVIYAPESSDSLFNSFTNLTSINFGDNFNTSKVTSMGQMFYGCSSLTELDVSNFDTSNVEQMTYIFKDCSSLTSLNLNKFDTSNALWIDGMFDGCSSLKTLDLSNFNTSKVKRMSQLFYKCSSLENVKISSFDTTNVITMRFIFAHCSSLTSLDLSNIDTSSVTDTAYMFYECSSLTSLDLSNFNTSNVTDMNNMFTGCKALTSLDLSSFNTSKVTNMSWMFMRCSNLTSLNVSSFDTSKVTNMDRMFCSCSSLTNLSVTNFNTSNVTNMALLFNGCSSLTTIVLTGFDTSKVENMTQMFNGCSKIKTQINIKNANITNYTNMFSGAATNSSSSIIIGYISTTQTIATAMRNTCTDATAKNRITLKAI